MSKLIKFICGTIVAPLTLLAEVEQHSLTQLPGTMPIQPMISQESLPSSFQELTVEHKNIPIAAPVQEKAITPFTGKIRGRKVRMRNNADLESRIIKELDKNELVVVVAEKGDFYAVEAPRDMKAFVFRSFVLDNVVEGNRVNVRLFPDTEAPVLGHLNAGDAVQSKVCLENNKWLEINIPSSVHFFIAKDYIENVGGCELKAQMDKRKDTVEQMLENSAFLAKAELRKPFAEIDIDRIQQTYKKIINDYVDFPEQVEQARDAMVALQDAFIQKRIAFLESKIQPEDSSATNLVREELVTLDSHEARTEAAPTDKMLLWEPIEEALYLNWTAMHEDRSMQEYYEEQKSMAISISGILESYSAPVKNKPGDFIIREKDLPVAYVYSTKLNLQDLVGKKVVLTGLERSNNNFAFPAYFVVSYE
jgi:hypothetical protein